MRGWILATIWTMLLFITMAASQNCSGVFTTYLVVDGSASISHENFGRVKEALKIYINGSIITNNAVKIGVVVYSDYVTEVINASSDVISLNIQVDNITHPEGGTATNQGIDRAKELLLTDPSNNPMVMIVITDGLSQQGYLTNTSAQQARDVGIAMIAMGVSGILHDFPTIKQRFEAELQGIAGSIDTVVLVKNFTDLVRDMTNVTMRICRVVILIPRQLEDLTVLVGSNPSFRTTLSQANIRTGTWTWQGRDLTTDNRYVINVQGNVQTLTIPNVQLSQSGNYTYTIGTIPTTATLTVLDLITNLTVPYGQTATFQTTVFPSSAGYWSKDGNRISTSSKYVITENGENRELRIIVVFGSDQGRYSYTVNGVSTTGSLTMDVVVVHGGYTTWSPWIDITSCIATCGNNALKTARRTRSCNNPPPANGGNDCQLLGPFSETTTVDCGQSIRCAVDGGVGQWGTWSSVACPVTCGFSPDGVRNRSRLCDSPEPSGGGRNCTDSLVERETRPCNAGQCPTDGGISPWTSWGPAVCNVTCGENIIGVSTRERFCNRPIPSFGGKNCTENRSETIRVRCSLPPCPVDGNWGGWTAWNNRVCDKPCGTNNKGRETRTRECDNPRPATDGNTCPGLRVQIQAVVCPDVPCPVDGNWGEWSAWLRDCNQTICGINVNGTESRRRLCNNPAPSFNGSKCQGDPENSRTIICPVITCPVHGQWGTWQAWNIACNSASCGNFSGGRSRMRQCNNPPPSDKGRFCPGDDIETRLHICSKTACPVNGGLSVWGPWSSLGCSVTCGNGSEAFIRRRSCSNPFPQFGGLNCTGHYDDNDNGTCIRTPCAGTVDGNWAPWSSWSIPKCAVSCGKGQIGVVSRERQCTDPSPQFDGRECEGEKNQTSTRLCGLQFCPIIQTGLSNTMVVDGKTVTMQVTLTRSNVGQGIWLKDGNMLSSAERIGITATGRVRTLTVRNVVISDGGLYKFEVDDSSTEATLTVKVFEIGLKDISVDIGSPVFLQVVLGRQTSDAGVWYKDTAGIQSVPGKRMIQSIGTSRQLVIFSAQSSDAGSYTLAIGNQSTSANLRVGVTIISRFSNSTVQIGRNVTLEVELSQPNITEGYWSRNNLRLSPSIKHLITVNGSMQILTILNVQTIDEGRYTYRINGQTAEATLTVPEVTELRITSPLQSMTVTVGKTEVLQVSLSQENVEQGKWMKDGINLTNTNNRFATVNGFDHRLVFVSTTAADTGMYTYNVGERLSSTAEFTALDIKITSELEPVVIKLGGTAVLQTTLTHGDIRMGKWFKGDVELTTRNNIIISTNERLQTLTIFNVQQNDIGSYRYKIGTRETSAVISVDGVWREWNPWVPIGQCNVTCGRGYQPYTRSRVCIQSQVGGQPCQGNADDTTTRDCNANACPINGVWEEWSPWVATRQCNVTCGGGSQPYTRSRACIQPQSGGQPCQGSDNDATTRVCNTNACPNDGIWGEWSPWLPSQQCNVTCGGSNQPYTRSRVCLDGQTCQGSAIDAITRVCNTNACPIDGVWEEWSPWVATRQCSVTCGGGSQPYTSFRVCIQPQFGGQPCQGSDNDATTRVCNTNACPNDGIWGEWSPWLPSQQCNVTCGGSNQPYTRSRVCLDGQTCQGSAIDAITRVCNTNACPIDGEWREWSPWVATRQCNVTCGGGYQPYTRSRVCIQPQFGGQPCQGSVVDATTRVCNTNACVDPPILVGLQDRSVFIGDSVTFTVTLLSTDITSGIWLKDNVRLSNTNRIQISVAGTQQRLRISNVQLSDAGSYRYVFNGGATTATLTFNPVRDMCEDATRVNNVGYRYHPTDCDKYIQCYYNPNGNVLGVYRSCSFGYYWNQVTQRCDESWRVTCPQEKCSSSCSPSHKMEGSCRSYWKCGDSYSEGRCCPVGQRFIPGKGCQGDLNCEDECPPPHISRDPCDKLPDWDTDPATYIMAMGTIVENRSCESGSTFDILECGCKQQHNGMCEFNYSSTFSSQNFPSWMAVTSTGFANNEAILNATSKMVLDIEMMTTNCPVVFTLKYRESSSSPGRRVLASSSDCRRNNSLLIYADEQGIHFHIKSWLDQVTKMMISTAGMLRSSWKTVTVTYNSRHLVGVVKSDTGRRTYVSRIHAPDASIVECGLRIGSDGSKETTTAFLGSVDMLSVHQCDIGDLY